jgi:hypothetical protein
MFLFVYCLRTSKNLRYLLESKKFKIVIYNVILFTILTLPLSVSNCCKMIGQNNYAFGVIYFCCTKHLFLSSYQAHAPFLFLSFLSSQCILHKLLFLFFSLLCFSPFLPFIFLSFLPSQHITHFHFLGTFYLIIKT